MAEVTQEQARRFAANRAITNAWSNATTTGNFAAVGIAACFPVGIMFAGMAGAIGVGALAVAVVGIKYKEAYDDTQAIIKGDLAAMGEHLVESDYTEIGAFSVYGEDYQQHLREAPPPKALPQAKPPAATATQTETGTGMPSAKSGDPSEATAPNKGFSEGAKPTLPRAIAQLDDAAPHLLMAGKTREGKSETLKHLIGAEKRVWYVTSKFTDKVPEHWKGYRVGGQQLGEQMSWLLDRWESALEKHLEGVDIEPEWFVIDEAIGILQSLKTKGYKETAERLRGFIVEVVTSGAAVNAMVGLLSQTGNSGPIGIDLDLLQNFSIVACGKRKKPQALAAFIKLTGIRMSADHEREFLSLTGYWQLWENSGPCLSQVPLSEMALKDVLKCPTAGFVREPAPEPEPTKQPLKDRIIGWLAQRTEPEPAWMIRNYCTDKSDRDRPDVLAIKDLLATMPEVRRVVVGNTEKYEVISNAS